MNSAKNKILQLYNRSAWIKFFTWIRFWTGSYESLEKYVPKNGRILDLGCGYGIFANFLALTSSKRIVYGVDTDKWKIDNADYRIKNAKFKFGDATKTNIKDLEAILVLDVLHHLSSYSEQEKLIEDCEKMLKKKGVLIITEVNNKPFWKLFLARLADFALYKGDKVYYRYRGPMLKMLSKTFDRRNIKSISFQTIVFPRILYICVKI